MKQMTLASGGFERYRKRTRRAAFLADMAHRSPVPSQRDGMEPAVPDYRYLSRMSLSTDFTPLTPRATSTALLMSAWYLTKPLS